jgi:hypothetical protein
MLESCTLAYLQYRPSYATTSYTGEFIALKAITNNSRLSGSRIRTLKS